MWKWVKWKVNIKPTAEQVEKEIILNTQEIFTPMNHRNILEN